ncbi:MAG: tRNA (adenosine(37)-N6)-threonylcarbamoyltransferase complex ATPase subunit type 1 TsaE [Treponemataceae bacterium]
MSAKIFTFITKTENETIELGKKLGEKLKPNSVIALNAPLASGKTYFTKGIARGLGIAEEVTSPTFTIVSEYAGRLHLYHIDAYRLGGVDEFYDIGAEDMLYDSGVCVIEWANIVEELLPKTSLNINIAVQADNSRLFTLSYSGETFDFLSEFPQLL